MVEKESLNDALETAGLAGNARHVLADRYNSCDFEGHFAISGNYCNHCYRHLDYAVLGEPSAEKKSMAPPLLYHFARVSGLSKEEFNESIHKSVDYYKGIEKIVDELKKDLDITL